MKCVKEYYLNDTYFFLFTCLAWSRKKFITQPKKKENEKKLKLQQTLYGMASLLLGLSASRHSTWMVALQSKQITQQQSFAVLDFTCGDSAPFLKAACHFVYITHGSQQRISGTPKRKEATTREPLLSSCGLGDSFPEQSAGVSRTTGT